MKSRKNVLAITRPDKMIMAGLKSLGNLGEHFVTGAYSRQRSQAKGNSETVFIGKKKLEQVAFQLFEYDEHSYEESAPEDFGFFDKLDPSKYYWLNFHGLHEVGLYQDLAKKILLDRLTVRQMLDTTQRPKVEEYERYLFFSVKSILHSEVDELNIEQISFVLSSNYVISFQEEVSDHFDHIRNKIRDKLGLIRSKQSDYLLVQLLDAVLDNYFETIDTLNVKVAALEKICLKSPKQDTLLMLEKRKRETQVIKKSLMPFKEALTHILNDRGAFIRKENKKYFRDLLNNSSSAMEEIDATSKSLESLTNIYFASLSHKMNEAMKVLTTVATIFIPLTFIVGVYGMNFENMPELEYRYGYFVTWGVMGIIVILMLVFFRRKNWL